MLSSEYRILIVDDTPKNIQVAAGFLENEGYTLSFATSGKEALELLKDQRYDLVLLDVLMPELDGFATCRRIKASSETSEIPVIFLTVKDDSESIIEGFESGGVDYITKPFNPHELLARVRTHLSLKHHIEVNRKNNEMLLQKSRSGILSELISNIAHQWRQPLTVISLTMSEISDSIIGAESPDRAYLDELVTKAQAQIQEMSTTITNFSHYFSPHQNKEVFGMDPLFNEVRTLAGGLFDNTVRIRWELEEHLYTEGYPGELMQTLLIVLNNARDALAESERKQVRIRTRRHGETITIEICDSGEGITEGMETKMFDPYTTTKHMAVNTGLSLYVAKLSIENNMNGEIIGTNATFEVDGEVYSGACFMLTLPVA